MDERPPVWARRTLRIDGRKRINDISTCHNPHPQVMARRINGAGRRRFRVCVATEVVSEVDAAIERIIEPDSRESPFSCEALVSSALEVWNLRFRKPDRRRGQLAFNLTAPVSARIRHQLPAADADARA